MIEFQNEMVIISEDGFLNGIKSCNFLFFFVFYC